MSNRILTGLSLLCLSFPVGYFAVNVAACHNEPSAAVIKTDVRAVWDCAAPGRAVLVSTLAPVALQLLEVAVDLALHDPAPAVNYAPVLAALGGVRDDILPCVIAVATSEILTHTSPRTTFVGSPQPSGPLIRAAFERLRIERFGSATFVGVVGF